VFRKSDSMDDRAEFFLDQWEAFGAAGDGRSAMQNFRRNYVPPPPYSADVLDLSERRQIIADIGKNRERLLARGFSVSSPNIKFIDDSVRKLNAVGL